MKTPFRLQATGYDCVPTTFINALVYLFHRGEIPPAVLQRVYMLSIDCIFHTNEHGEGTSDLAINYIASWLNEFRSTKFGAFSVEAEYIKGSALHPGSTGRLAQCLNYGGVGVLGVKHFRRLEHEILALKIEDEWLYAFDPYPRSPSLNRRNCFQYLAPVGKHDPNLRIKCSWLNVSSDDQPFQLGPLDERGAVLMRR